MLSVYFTLISEIIVHVPSEHGHVAGPSHMMPGSSLEQITVLSTATSADKVYLSIITVCNILPV